MREALSINEASIGCELICEINGGLDRGRTDDLLRAKQALYQLSYEPVTIARKLTKLFRLGNRFFSVGEFIFAGRPFG